MSKQGLFALLLAALGAICSAQVAGVTCADAANVPAASPSGQRALASPHAVRLPQSTAPTGISHSETIRVAAKKGRRGIRRFHRRRSLRRRRALRTGIAIGVGIAIVGIIASQSVKSASFRAAMRRCALRYRSFDWETGTYVTYDGRVRLCPYLRPYY